jgi:hypothetical protein
VLNDHAGIVFGRLVLVLAVVAGAGLLLAGRGRVSSVVQCPPFNTRWIACSLLVAFIGPYLALTSDEAKSVVVGDVLLPPLILVVICAFAQATSWTGKGSKAPRYVLLGITAALLAVGLRSEWNQFQLSSYETDQLGPATGSRLIENVGGYVENHLGGHATWATDGHLDFSPPLVTRLFYYEQHGKWLSLVSTLGDGSIQTVLTPEEILRQAGSSDVLIITRGGTPLYPYDQSIDAVKGPLFAMAIQQYRLMDEYQIGDRDVFVYVR